MQTWVHSIFPSKKEKSLCWASIPTAIFYIYLYFLYIFSYEWHIILSLLCFAFQDKTLRSLNIRAEWQVLKQSLFQCLCFCDFVHFFQSTHCPLEQNPTTRAGGRHQVGLDWQADIMPFHSEICRGTATHNVELTRLQSVTQDSSRRLCAFVPTAARRLSAPLLLQTDRTRAALFSWKRSISHKPPMQVTAVMQAVALRSSGWAADTLRLTAS